MSRVDSVEQTSLYFSSLDSPPRSLLSEDTGYLARLGESSCFELGVDELVICDNIEDTSRTGGDLHLHVRDIA